MSYDESRAWIVTFTGQKFFPLHPDPATFDIRDQVHALSQLCRYTGQCSRFYSVAEHAVRVSRLLEQGGASLEIQRRGLIHDNAEAYFNDLNRPLKHHPLMIAYRRAERRCKEKIEAWAGFARNPAEASAVSEADNGIYAIECRQLGMEHPDWPLPPPMKCDTIGWLPETAERTYLARFEKLFGARELFYAGARTLH